MVELEDIANEIFRGESKPAYSVELLPEDGTEIPNSDEELSESIVSMLSIITTFGIQILFGKEFHPQNVSQINKLNDHLKCLGWNAVFTCMINPFGNGNISKVKIGFKPAPVQD